MVQELLALEDTSEIVSFNKLYRMVWRMKWFIIVLTSCFAIGSAYIAIQKPNVYTAKGIFVPAQSDDGGGLSNLASQFGGIASMAGINLGGGKGDDNQVAIVLLKSRSFLQRFIAEHELLPELLAATHWDKENDLLVYNEKIYNSQTKKWTRSKPPGREIVPTPWEAYEKLLTLLSIQYQDKKGIINISITFLSPELSTKWLKWLVADLNSYWRTQEKEEAENSIKYLQRQVELTNNSEMQSIFYSIIASQTQQVLLTEVKKEYLFKTLTPIVTPEQKSSPSRAFLCMVGTFIGGLLSLLLSFIYVIIRPEKPNDKSLES
ncbi:MAG: LPS O-antigen subunit length determinant protein (WzzB/FepE family) [Alteromonadaceae bacterium]|jgi:LPS O-antigen subunit length determinant protein (WzzB/FepE family)